MRTPTLLFLIASLVFIVRTGTNPGDQRAGSAVAAAPTVSESPDDHHGSLVGETRRVSAHLRAVERELRSADVSHLPDERRAARAELLDWLAEYRAGGTFPHNHTHPGERVPVFVDVHDTPCAVGYLLLRSGEESLVADVVALDNNVRVHELAADERVRDWLEAHGLTLDEAARIQPAYGECPGGLGCWGDEPEPTLERYVPKTVGLAGLTAGAMAWGLVTERPSDGVDWPGWVALGAGVADGIYAIRGNRDGQDGWAVGVNILAGFGGAAVGFHRLLARDAGPGTLEQAAVDVAPWLSGERAGFALRVRH
jgi:hypothetical protein